MNNKTKTDEDDLGVDIKRTSDKPRKKVTPLFTPDETKPDGGIEYQNQLADLFRKSRQKSGKFDMNKVLTLVSKGKT